MNGENAVAPKMPGVRLRNYFETDFPMTATVRYELRVKTASSDEGIALYAQAHLDFGSHVKYCSFYIPVQTELPHFEVCKMALAKVRDVLALRGGAQFVLPSSRYVNLGLQIEFLAAEFLDVKISLPEGGKYDVCDFQIAPPVYFYSDLDLTPDQLLELTRIGRRQNAIIRFRGQEYAMKRATEQHPAAFISHDTRDKESIARPLAVGLSAMGHSVWFDEFSLKPGDRLRESIEDGIKRCRYCVLVLTPNFLGNRGWAATEFNSIFTREIIEEKGLVIPVWAGVTKQDVYNYSPGLLNVLGAHWDPSDETKGIRAVARALEALPPTVGSF